MKLEKGKGVESYGRERLKFLTTEFKMVMVKSQVITFSHFPLLLKCYWGLPW